MIKKHADIGHNNGTIGVPFFPFFCAFYVHKGPPLRLVPTAESAQIHPNRRCLGPV